MWESGYRHNPFSMRYRYYLDHRPVLPQDDSWWFLKKTFDKYQLIYFNFKTGPNQNLFLLSNNIPVEERENLKIYFSAYTRFLKNMNLLAIIPTFFLYKWSTSCLWIPKYKISKILAFGGCYIASVVFVRLFLKESLESNLCYFLHKYRPLAKENLLEIDDPRRKFFRVDTSEYYRESASDILHPEGSHGGGHGGSHGHDTSNYYGPHPVIKKIKLV